MSKFFNRIKRNKSFFILNAVLLAVILLFFWIKPVDCIRDYDIYRQSGKGKTVSVFGENEVSQEFICNGADSLELNLSGVKNFHGFFEVALYSSDGECIKNWKTDKLDINNGLQGEDKWIRYQVGKDILKTGEQYRIVISAPELDQDTALIVTTVPASDPIPGTCMVNGEESDRVLAFSTYRDLSNPFYPIAVVILFLTANIWWFNRRKNIVRSALWILLGTGLIFLTIMAPGSQPDEYHHYCSAFKLSNIMLGRINVNEIENTYMFDLDEHLNSNQSFKKVETTILAGNDEELQHIHGVFRGVLAEQPAAYFAPALGITVGRLLNGSFILVYTLGRLFNLILYIIMAYAAIRIMPVNRELMLLISIIPMAMHQAVSMSYDVIVNGTGLLFFAYIASFVFAKKTFTWLNAVVCTVMIAIAGPIKVVYCLLILLIFVIPGKQFRHSRGKLILGIMIVAAVAIALLIMRGSTLSSKLSGDSFNESDYYYGSFVLSYPGRWIRMLLGSAEYSTWSLLKEEIGYRLAGLKFYVSEYYIIAYMAVLILASLKNDTQPEMLFNRKQKIISAGTAILGLILLFAIFAFVWTPYGKEIIEGMQGRYLLPFVPPLLYSLAGNRITVHFTRYRLMYPVWFIYAGFIADVMSKITV